MSQKIQEMLFPVTVILIHFKENPFYVLKYYLQLKERIFRIKGELANHLTVFVEGYLVFLKHSQDKHINIQFIEILTLFLKFFF